MAPVRPSKPTVPVTESVRQGVVVERPREPVAVIASRPVPAAVSNRKKFPVGLVSVFRRAYIILLPFVSCLIAKSLDGMSGALRLVELASPP